MDGDILAAQLAQLGKQLDEATSVLADFDVLATGAGIEFQRRKEVLEDALAHAFQAVTGAVETRKTVARLHCTGEQKDAHEAYATWERAKCQVRNQQAAVRAINARIDIGRSLLSREKSLLSLGV